MWERYGTAVVEERVTPRNLAAIAEYARTEYGPGTGFGYFLAHLEDGQSSDGRDPRRIRGIVRAVAAAIRSFVPANGHARGKPGQSRVDE